MKKVLIISPSFPPVNTADMHRVRMSLPYFKEYGWMPTVIAVKPEYVEAPIDVNLLLTIPKDIAIFHVKAFPASITRKFGLGNLGFRVLLQTFLKCRSLVKKEKYDLIYFSTTAFPVMAIGRILKALYNIPYVVDIQDPWRPDHYLGKPKHQQPPKFKVSYKINSILERFTIPYASGIIAVSKGYIDTLKERYKLSKDYKTEVVTFGASDIDYTVLNNIHTNNVYFETGGNYINVLYIGRGGYDLHYSLRILFQALKKGLTADKALFSRVRLYFIGTSYAKNGTGKKTIEPLAEEYGIAEFITEITERIPYFETLSLLKDADLLFIPGSTEANYTASKLYPYILSEKQIIALFHENSSVVRILEETKAGKAITYNLVNDNIEELIASTLDCFIKFLRNRESKLQVNWNAFSVYSARQMTLKQVNLFNSIVSRG